MATTVIRNADWAILWDAEAGRHVYRRGVDLAFEDDRITFADMGYDGPADTLLDNDFALTTPSPISAGATSGSFSRALT